MIGTKNAGIAPKTQSRYEVGLFDIENPDNQNLVRLENLFIRYKRELQIRNLANLYQNTYC